MGLSLVHANGLRRMHSRSGRIEHWQNAAHRFIRAAHGIRHSNRKSFIGDLWYRNEVELNPEEIQGAVHIRFPSLSNECWLYVNGEEAAHHKQGQL